MKKLNLLSVFIILIGVFLFNASLFAQTYKIVETGQVTCYDEDGNTITCPSVGDSLYGQDAQYEGYTMAFIDNGDGTITDLNTGLMWQQDPSSQTFTYYQAQDHCEDLELAGYDDWRAPNLKELFSISNFNSGWPYLNTNYFTLASGQVTKDEQYWSSNHYVGVTVEGGSDAAFGVNHVTGHIKAYPANAGGPIGGKYVRAVRGNTYGENEFVDNGDGTISDNASGLMWTQDDLEDEIEWKDALAYAENSEYADYTDWKLPDVKELHSIVDYSYSPSATDPDEIGPAIDPMFNCSLIINEAGDEDYAYYWSSTSGLFQANGPYYYAWYVAFGRAVNGEGDDLHGAGGIRFDTKYEGGPSGEGGERYYNQVRLVRDIGTTDINEESSLDNSSFKIYPNPASDHITIEGANSLTGTCTIQIIDVVGKVVYSANDELEGSTRLNINSLQQGIYFLTITNDTSSRSGKLIIR